MATKKDTENTTETPQETQKNEEKSKNVWTLKRCLKAARRFASLEEWAKGAPSSYKAAASHGWLDQGKAQMRKVEVGKAKKTQATVPTTRKSA